MKEIRLKRLRLLNFKGFRDFEINFEGERTNILARNGKGKSTVLDAFSWLLFGKDRKGREATGKSSFGLKTYDENGVVIPRIPHEVEGVLTVDGDEVVLRRTLTEKWVKKIGASEEKFKGHESARFYNDVPCSEDEWSQKIAEICPEETLKLITDIERFGSIKKEDKRKLLVQMAGGVSDAEIAEGNDDFIKLLALLTKNKKTLDELKKEVTAKRLRVKTEVEGIPGRIDEVKREMPEVEDWDKISVEISQKETEIERIEGQIMSDAKRREETDNRRLEIAGRIHEIRSKIQRRSHDISDKAFESYRDYQLTRNSLLDEKRTLAKTVEVTEARIKNLETDHAAAKSSRDRMLKDYETLKAKSKQIKSEQLQISENDFKCPTCGRIFEPDQIEAKQSEMLARFEEQRKARFDAVTEEINENIARGRRNNDNMTSILKEIEDCKLKIANSKKRIVEIDGSDALKKSHTPPDVAPLIEADEEIRELRNEEEQLVSMATPQTTDDDSSFRNELSAQREALRKEIKDLQQRMFKRDEINRRTKRINDLTAQLQQQNQELTSLQKLEMTIAAFAKSRIDAVEDKINSMFGIVKFKLFNRLVNGGEEEICDATFNGVPYPDCSTAERINMGLDIINAISKFKGVSAPVFIDNAESVIDILPTGTQVIRLVVSPEHEQLTIL